VFLSKEMHLAEVASRRRLYVKEATAYTSSLPRSIKIGSRKLTLAEDANDKAGLYDSSRDRLFVNKCLCYVSQHQFLAAFRALLHSLYARHTAPLPHLLPVESYIFNVLYEISTPSPGQSSRFYFYPESHFLLQRPSM
jgi:DENN domain-containing protein 5